MTGARRALLIGSQTHGLRGVAADVQELGDVLSGLGFVTDRRIGTDRQIGAASADGIAAAYRDLITDTRPGDAVVVYYSGHGGREPAPQLPSAPRWLQYIVPTDVGDRTGDRARVVLAEELSLWQLELTSITPNVTTIFDCCHAARMSRDPSAVPRATRSGLPRADLERRWAALRADPRLAAVTTDGNPLAIRVAACAPDETALEREVPALGGRRHGVLTAALIGVLTGGDPAELTWREVRDLLRVAVSEFSPQRPEIAAQLERNLFALTTRPQTGVRPVRVVDGVALLDAAALFGIAAGDVYRLLAPRRRPGDPLVRAVVDRVVDGRAVLQLAGAAAADLVAGTAAWPVEVAVGARPVVVLPPDAPARAAIVAELERTAHVRVEPDPVGALATVRLDGDDVQLLDAIGAPLYRDGLAAASVAAADVADDVRALARAAWVRELPSGTGEEELTGSDVAISWLRVRSGHADEPLEQGAHLFVGDELVVRAANDGGLIRYVSMIDVGLAGALRVLSSSEPDGVTVAPNSSYELGRGYQGRAGYPLEWLAGLPTDRPRTESVVTIVADGHIDGLGELTQTGVVPRSNKVRTGVGRLLQDVVVGRRARGTGGPPNPVRYRVVPFDFTLHPTPRPADGPAEPVFAVDERPDDSVRLVTPGPADGEPVRRIAVRLLAWAGPRPFRVDCLLAPAGEPFRAGTTRVDELPDGGLLLDEGPVGRFVDLALWAGPDTLPPTALPELLAAEPMAPVADGSAGAAAALVATAARLLGDEPRVLRTVLLPTDRFGTGEGRLRHPTAGLLRADAVGMAIEIVDLDAAGVSGSEGAAAGHFTGEMDMSGV